MCRFNKHGSQPVASNLERSHVTKQAEMMASNSKGSNYSYYKSQFIPLHECCSYRMYQLQVHHHHHGHHHGFDFYLLYNFVKNYRQQHIAVIYLIIT